VFHSVALISQAVESHKVKEYRLEQRKSLMLRLLLIRSRNFFILINFYYGEDQWEQFVLSNTAK